MNKLPDDQKKVTINMKIDPDLLRRLESFSERHLASRSRAIRRGIELLLEVEET